MPSDEGPSDLAAPAGDDWIDEFRELLSGSPAATAFRRYVELEAQATGLLSYEPELVPGLLQSSAYIRAVADRYRPVEPPERRERFVAFRQERQRRLGDRHFHVVINELAIRQPICSTEVMSEQLTILVDEIRGGRVNVTIAIAPSSLTIPASAQGAFVVMHMADRQYVVSMEDPFAGPTFYTDPDTVAEFEGYHAALVSNSLGGSESLALVEGMIEN